MNMLSTLSLTSLKFVRESEDDFILIHDITPISPMEETHLDSFDESKADWEIKHKMLHIQLIGRLSHPSFDN